MPHHRATLIQPISEYVALLQWHLEPILHAFISHGIGEEEVLAWIIAEELELVYGLFTQNHHHNYYPYVAIHACLSGQVSLSALTQIYIKAPKLYPDHNQIHLMMNQFDLIIEYYADPPPTPPRLR